MPCRFQESDEFAPHLTAAKFVATGYYMGKLNYVTPNDRTKSLVGQTFGLLTVIRRNASIGRNPAWLCQCACGQQVTARGDKLKSGDRKACAVNGHYWATENSPGFTTLHPAEYKTWSNIHRRCTSKRDKDWRNYGSRGIKVCERWVLFANFYADMGDRPSPKHTIDRKDNDGDYEPDNCRWATKSEQRRNTRDNIYVEYRGERLLLCDLLSRLKLNYDAVKGRITNGWSLERAITTPIRFKRKNRVK